MNNIIIFSSVVFFVFISGCSAIAEKITNPTPKSKYMPKLNSDKEIDTFVTLITNDSGKVLNDEIGRHFIVNKREYLERVFLSKQDDGSILNLLSNQTGLLEPIYVYKEDGHLEPDWNATSLRHRFLTEKAKLKLLPMSETKQYNELIKIFSSTEIKRISSTGEIYSSAFSGNFGLYNNKFSEEVLKKMNANFAYLVSGQMTEDYFGDLYIKAYKSPESVDFYNRSTIGLFLSQNLKFIPVNLLGTLKKGGVYRVASGCSAFYPEKWKDFNKVSNQEVTKKDGDYRELKLAKKSLLDSQESVNKRRQDYDEACIDGLRGLGVSGAIDSKRLK